MEIQGLADCNMEILGPGVLGMQVGIPMFIGIALQLLQHCHVSTLYISCSLRKEIEFLTQTFDISNLDYLI